MNPWGLFVLALGLAMIATGVKGNQRTVLSILTGHTPAAVPALGTSSSGAASNASALSVGTGANPAAPPAAAPQGAQPGRVLSA